MNRRQAKKVNRRTSAALVARSRAGLPIFPSAPWAPYRCTTLARSHRIVLRDLARRLPAARMLMEPVRPTEVVQALGLPVDRAEQGDALDELVRQPRAGTRQARIELQRSPEPVFPRREILRGEPVEVPERLVDYATFHASAALAARRTAGPGDYVVVCTDPPLLSATIQPMLRSGTRLVNWLQDLFPEVACSLGIGGLDNGLGTMLRHLRGAGDGD